MAEDHLSFDVRRTDVTSSGNNPTEVLREIMGRFGRYQLMVWILCASSKFATAMNMMGIIFWGPKQNFSCNGVPDACPCDNPVFNEDQSATLISQFDLVCSRDIFKTLAQALFQLGVLVGSFLFGTVSDRWGRRNSLLIASLIQMVFSITSAAATNIYVFLCHRVIIGISTGGVIVIGFVLMNEFLHPKDRDIMAPCFFLAFNFFCMFVPLFGYLIRNWRYFQIASGLTSFIMLPMICYLPESPRWDIAEGKTERAIKTLERLRRWNKMPTEMVRPSVMKIHGMAEKAMNVKAIHLVKNPIMRRYFLVMCYEWLTASMVFYGVSQLVGRFSGDLYVNTAFNQVMNFFGCSFGVPITYFSPRKPQMFCLLVISGVTMMLSKAATGFLRVFFATVCSVTGFMSFNLCFIYGSELYPTVIRSRAMGINSVGARLGSTVAPVIVDRVPTDWVPVVFGLPLIIGAFLSCLLDETKGTELPATIDDLKERIANNKAKKRRKKEAKRAKKEAKAAKK